MTENRLSPEQRMLIEHECEKLVRRYALYVDEGAYDLLADLFAKEAVFARPTAPDQPITGRDTIMAGFRKRPADRTSRHLTVNCVVEADDETAAHGQSYMVLYQGPRGEDRMGPSGPSVIDKPVMIGAFEDRFVFEDGAWRFLVRQGSIALTTG